MKTWPLQRILRHLAFWVVSSGLLLLLQLPSPMFIGMRLYLRTYVVSVLPSLENAFRHGTGAGLDCAWVSIDVVARPAGLTFKIINSQPPAAPGLRKGPPKRDGGHRRRSAGQPQFHVQPRQGHVGPVGGSCRRGVGGGRGAVGVGAGSYDQQATENQ